MNQAAVLDSSIFIWDKQHFEENKSDYYTLMGTLPDLYDALTANQTPILLRGQLYQELLNYFPYDLVPNQFFEFQRLTLSFFTKINIVGFSANIDNTIISSPNLLKAHFKDTTISELKCLLTYLHNTDNTEKVFLTFLLFWKNDTKLIIKNSHEIEVETTLCDDLSMYNKLTSSFKKIFEHNPKHSLYKTTPEKYRSKGGISPLSCYNEREGDKTKAQSLLDKSVDYKGDFYAKDDNGIFVLFYRTRSNVYHGFDIELPEGDRICIEKLLDNEQL